MIIQILLAPSFLFIKLFFPAVIDMKRLNAVGIYRISDDLLTISKQADIEKLYSNESRFLKFTWLPVKSEKSICCSCDSSCYTCTDDSKDTHKPSKKEYEDAYLPKSSPSQQCTTDDSLKRDIFLFCVFSGHFAEARRLCYHLKKPYMGCLWAAKICRKAARKLGWVNHKRFQDLKDQAERFSELAADLLDRTHDYNCSKRDWKELLLEKDYQFFDDTPWDLIQRSYCRNIHKSNLVHKYIQLGWYGYIDNRAHFIHIRVFFATLLLPMLPLALVFPSLIPFHKTGTKQKKIFVFYRAPIVQFYYYNYCYISFLIVFGYTMIMAYFPTNIYGEMRSNSKDFIISGPELIMHLWMMMFSVEQLLEIIQTVCQHGSICAYLRRPWNILDSASLIFYMTGFVCRWIPGEIAFTISKVLMCIAFILWSARLLRMFAAYKYLGLSLFLIFRMLRAPLFFFFFFLVNIFAFSIAVKALHDTKTQVIWFRTDDGRILNATVVNGGNGNGYDTVDWIVIKNLINWGIWKLIGQVDLATDDSENAYTLTIWVLTIIFVCITHILLLNALIVLFNAHAEETKINAIALRRSEHFLLAKKFWAKDYFCVPFKQSILPPPFNGGWYVGAILYFLVEKCRKGEPFAITDIHECWESCVKSERWVDAALSDCITKNPEILISYNSTQDMDEREDQGDIKTVIANCILGTKLPDPKI